jgi:hypothetical protein
MRADLFPTYGQKPRATFEVDESFLDMDGIVCLDALTGQVFFTKPHSRLFLISFRASKPIASSSLAHDFLDSSHEKGGLAGIDSSISKRLIKEEAFSTLL